MSAARHDLQDFTAFADILADAARQAILPHFRAKLGVENKALEGFDPVTAADRAAEAAMRRLIEDRFPEHGIDGEEYGAKPSKNGWTWVLDPIDGTRAFIAGLPTWGTLIALNFEGKPRVGVIDQAYLDERFVGADDHAWSIVRGTKHPLRVRPCDHLRDAILATTDQNLFRGAECGGFEMVRHTAKLTRYGYDCYAYAMLAAGFIDMVIESGLKAHDVQALVPVIEGAGGLVTDWRGAPAWRGGQVIAASDPRIHEQALVALKRAAD